MVKYGVKYDGIVNSMVSCNLRYEGEVDVVMMYEVEAGKVGQPADRDGGVVPGTGGHGLGRPGGGPGEAGLETGEDGEGEVVTL